MPRRLKLFKTVLLIAFIVRHCEIHLQLAAAKENLNFEVPFLFPAEEPKAVVAPPAAFTRHIVAVGDLHGDYPNAQKVLQFSDVVDEYGNWAGNVDFFVQTGDIIDRSVRFIYRFCGILSCIQWRRHD